MHLTRLAPSLTFMMANVEITKMNEVGTIIDTVNKGSRIAMPCASL